MLEELAPRLALALGDLERDLDELRRRAFAVVPGPLGDQIDRAADLAVLADRDLAQDDRVHRIVLQRRDDVADAAGGLVDAVDEEHARRPRRLDRMQVRRGQHRRRRVGADADHRRVRGEERVGRDMQELDRARGVDRLPVLAEMTERRDAKLARRRRRLRLAFEPAHPVDQRRLAGVGRPENCDCPRHACFPPD